MTQTAKITFAFVLGTALTCFTLLGFIDVCQWIGSKF